MAPLQILLRQRPGSETAALKKDEGTSLQNEQLQQVVRSLILGLQQGEGASVVSYGSWGSGKSSALGTLPSQDAPNLLSHALCTIFSLLGEGSTLHLSCVEVLGDEYHDLLDNSPAGPLKQYLQRQEKEANRQLQARRNSSRRPSFSTSSPAPPFPLSRNVSMHSSSHAGYRTPGSSDLVHSASFRGLPPGAQQQHHGYAAPFARETPSARRTNKSLQVQALHSVEASSAQEALTVLRSALALRSSTSTRSRPHCHLGHVVIRLTWTAPWSGAAAFGPAPAPASSPRFSYSHSQVGSVHLGSCSSVTSMSSFRSSPPASPSCSLTLLDCCSSLAALYLPSERAATGAKRAVLSLGKSLAHAHHGEQSMALRETQLTRSLIGSVNQLLFVACLGGGLDTPIPSSGVSSPYGAPPSPGAVAASNDDATLQLVKTLLRGSRWKLIRAAAAQQELPASACPSPRGAGAGASEPSQLQGHPSLDVGSRGPSFCDSQPSSSRSPSQLFLPPAKLFTGELPPLPGASGAPLLDGLTMPPTPSPSGSHLTNAPDSPGSRTSVATLRPRWLPGSRIPTAPGTPTAALQLAAPKPAAAQPAAPEPRGLPPRCPAALRSPAPAFSSPPRLPPHSKVPVRQLGGVSTPPKLAQPAPRRMSPSTSSPSTVRSSRALLTATVQHMSRQSGVGAQRPPLSEARALDRTVMWLETEATADGRSRSAMSGCMLPSRRDRQKLEQQYRSLLLQFQSFNKNKTGAARHRSPSPRSGLSKASSAGFPDGPAPVNQEGGDPVDPFSWHIPAVLWTSIDALSLAPVQPRDKAVRRGSAEAACPEQLPTYCAAPPPAGGAASSAGAPLPDVSSPPPPAAALDTLLAANKASATVSSLSSAPDTAVVSHPPGEVPPTAAAPAAGHPSRSSFKMSDAPADAPATDHQPCGSSQRKALGPRTQEVTSSARAGAASSPSLRPSLPPVKAPAKAREVRRSDSRTTSTAERQCGAAPRPGTAPPAPAPVPLQASVKLRQQQALQHHMSRIPKRARAAGGHTDAAAAPRLPSQPSQAASVASSCSELLGVSLLLASSVQIPFSSVSLTSLPAEARLLPLPAQQRLQPPAAPQQQAHAHAPAQPRKMSFADWEREAVS